MIRITIILQWDPLYNQLNIIAGYFYLPKIIQSYDVDSYENRKPYVELHAGSSFSQKKLLHGELIPML